MMIYITHVTRIFSFTKYLKFWKVLPNLYCGMKVSVWRKESVLQGFEIRISNGISQVCLLILLLLTLTENMAARREELQDEKHNHERKRNRRSAESTLAGNRRMPERTKKKM